MIYLTIYLVGCLVSLVLVIYFDHYKRSEDVKASDLVEVLAVALFSWFTVIFFTYTVLDRSDFTIIKFKKK